MGFCTNGCPTLSGKQNRTSNALHNRLGKITEKTKRKTGVYSACSTARQKPVTRRKKKMKKFYGKINPVPVPCFFHWRMSCRILIKKRVNSYSPIWTV